MLLYLRKADLIIQAVLFFLSLIILFTTFRFDYLFYLEAVLGVWQVVSALLNTSAMHHNGNSFRKYIWIYWSLSIPAILLLVTFIEGLMMFSIIASWGIAIYYWIIYRAFIQHVSYRKELSTLVRSR